jgi:hypothetical protein
MIFNEDHEQNIDLKNRAEALCFEVEKELTLLKDKISENKQENITNLIQNIRNEIQNDNINALKFRIERLKVAILSLGIANIEPIDEELAIYFFDYDEYFEFMHPKFEAEDYSFTYRFTSDSGKFINEFINGSGDLDISVFNKLEAQHPEELGLFELEGLDRLFYYIQKYLKVPSDNRVLIEPMFLLILGGLIPYGLLKLELL